MKEVLENIWDWIDLYVWTLVAIALIILSIIFIVCEISITVSQKKVYKKQMEKHKQEEHDELAQIMNSHFMVIRGGRENGKSNIMFPTPIGCEKDKKVCKKCVNCKHYLGTAHFVCGKDKPIITRTCLEKNISLTNKEIYKFNKCKHFKEKDL